MGLVTASLADVAAITPRSRLLRLDLRGQPFAFLAGQAVMVGPHGADARRPFSIASSPAYTATTGLLELLIADDTGTTLDWAQPRTLVDVEGPLGGFTFEGAPRQPHVLFIAGGVGIAPLRAMIEQALHTSPAPSITLLYSARRGDDFAFIEEFESHARAGRMVLHQTVTRHDGTDWQGRRGRVGRGEFEAVLQYPTSTTCFVCGPNALVGETIETLRALGVPDDLVHAERWGR